MSLLGTPELWALTLSMSTPIACGALGGTFSERTGVVNIAMEGMMTSGAFIAVMGSYVTGSPWIGLVMAMAAGGLMALLFAWATIRFRANQVVTGMAIDILATGLTGYLLNTVYGYNGTPVTTPSLPVINMRALGHIPFFGTVFNQQSALVYIFLLVLVLSHLFLFKTPLGLRMRSVGENPRAADSAGLNVFKLRYAGVVMSGLLSGMGGAFLSIGILNSFNIGMVNGRGYIALAAMIFGNWTPWGSYLAALIFGFATALGMQLQNTSTIPKDLVLMLPYVLTVVALALAVRRSSPPAADGIPYDPGE